MASLVWWKQGRDKHNDEYDEEHDDAVRTPKLSHTIQEPKFIKRDEANAEVMEKLKIKW